MKLFNVIVEIKRKTRRHWQLKFASQAILGTAISTELRLTLKLDHISQLKSARKRKAELPLPERLKIAAGASRAFLHLNEVYGDH